MKKTINKCIYCGAPIKSTLISKSIKCSYCGNTFVLDNQDEKIKEESSKSTQTKRNWKLIIPAAVFGAFCLTLLNPASRTNLSKFYREVLVVFIDPSASKPKEKSKNSCPTGSAYVGNGSCREVQCDYPVDYFKSSKGHNPIVAGKSTWSCKYSFWFGAGLLKLSDIIIPAIHNPNCPEGIPNIGWNSTCEAPYTKKE